MDRVALDLPSPMVRVGWDRGHEVVEGIVRAWDDGGLVLTLLHDNVPLDGLLWIDEREVVDVDDLADDAPAVRLANLTGERRWAIDRSLAALPVLLATLRHEGALVMVHTVITGSDGGKVGRITSIDGHRVVLREVSTGARWTSDVVDVDLDDVVGVLWGNTYLRSITTLLEAESTGWMPPEQPVGPVDRT